MRNLLGCSGLSEYNSCQDLNGVHDNLTTGEELGIFPEDIVKQAWNRSKEQCECVGFGHRWHTERCPKKLVWENREKDVTGWEAHRVIAQEKGGKETLENCLVLCQRCHKATVQHNYSK